MAGLELLAAEGSEEDWVLVHDAARPCLPLESLTALIERARQSGEGAILAEPVADTLKQIGEDGQISGTVDRQSLWRAQTPQLFPLFALRAALGRCLEEGLSVTDEAMAMERMGEPVHVVEGPSSNIKVTVEADLAFADLVLRKRGGQ
jgi:2-C-methyl-D-erythritol 4-phosphate cytidylyltransferase